CSSDLQIGLCDANFGILERDIDIVDRVVARKEKTGWPDFFLANMAKNSAKRVAEISLKLFHANLAGDKIAISFQTLDQETLANIDRNNIKISDYEEVLSIFRKNKIPMLTELMLGLPGQTFDKFQHDLQKSFDWMILACVFPVRVMPNAPMGDPEYKKKFRIKVD